MNLLHFILGFSVFVSCVFTALNFLQDPEAMAGAFFIQWPLALLHTDMSSSNFQAAVKDQTRYCQCYQYSFCLNKTILVAGLDVLDLHSKTKTATGYPKIEVIILHPKAAFLHLIFQMGIRRDHILQMFRC